MTLIDEARARRALRRRWVPAIEISGGSAANTDRRRRVLRRPRRLPRQGRATTSSATVFAHDIRSTGVTFDVAARGRRARRTGRCLIVVTPDAQRTMNTYLGASALFGPTTSTPTWSRAARGRVPRGLPLGPARGQGGVPQGRADRARGRQRGVAHALRLVLRRPAPARVARNSSRTTSTSSSRTRTRSARSTSATSTRRWKPRAPRLPRRRAHPVGSTGR